MRRKSTRNAAKASPEKPKEEKPAKKSRRSTRRQKPSSSESDSEEELSLAAISKETTVTEDIKNNKRQRNKAVVEEEEPVVRRSRRRGGSTPQKEECEDQDVEEEKKGKGKSKGKNKSKLEQASRVNVAEMQSEISENVQVTAQSPQIDNIDDADNVDRDDKRDDDNASQVIVEGEGKTSDGDVVSGNAAEQVSVNADSDVSEKVSEERVESSVDTSEKIANSEDNDKVIDAREENSVQKESVPSEDLPNEQSNSNAETELAANKDNIPPSIETTKAVTVESVNADQEIAAEKTESSEPDKPIEKDDNEKEEINKSDNVEVPSEKSDNLELQDHKSHDLQVNNTHCDEIKVNETKPAEIEDENIVNSDKTAASDKTDENAPAEVEITETSDDAPSKIKDAENAPCEIKETEGQEEKSEVDEAQPKAENNKSLEENASECVVTEQSSDEIDKPNNISEESSSKIEAVCSTENEIVANKEIVADQPSTVGEPIKSSKSKKFKWGNSNVGLKSIENLLEITLGKLSEVYPDMALLEEEDVRLEAARERRHSEKVERKISVEEKQKEDEVKDEEKKDVENIIAMNRKISIVDDDASKLRPPPSPAKNDKSNILYITNLVRPFTIKQLRELLERTGKIREDGFWTDRIKSKCYVCYETQEEAEATRNALHGVHWPIGNGKKLMIDYSTEESLENSRNPPPPPVVIVPIVPEVTEKENQEPESPAKKIRKESEGGADKEKKLKINNDSSWEADRRKDVMEIKRSRSKDKLQKRRHSSRSRHSRSPSHDLKRKQQKKADETVPQRAMDDLFRKTEATPCIYWQPLSPEEISLKQQQRLERMAEHKRRMQTQTRTKRGGADYPRGGGGPYRRRY